MGGEGPLADLIDWAPDSRFGLDLRPRHGAGSAAVKGIVEVPSLSLTTNRGEATRQHFVKQRATETGDIEFYTPAIDVVGVPQLTFELITYRLQGTTPQIVAQLQTTSDMETFSDVS